MRRSNGERSLVPSQATPHLFIKYAAITLAPVLALGVVLALSLGAQERHRGIDQAIAQARVVAATSVEPVLGERAQIRARVAAAVRTRAILGVRVYTTRGTVAFSSVGSSRAVSAVALSAAARGSTVAQLARLGSAPAVAVYEPLHGGGGRRPQALLEVYLPYAPIAAAEGALDRELAAGLTLLYLALLALTVSIRVGLRRQLAVNADQAQELRARAREHRMLFEDNPLPMIAYDRDTLRIVAVSNTACERYGWTREEFLTMSLPAIHPAEDARVLARRLDDERAIWRDGQEPVVQTRHRYKDGTVVDVELASQNVVVNGKPSRLMLCQDVTARNKATAELAIARDAAIEASNMKSAFLANVSHEIRTPMNGVLGMTELLLGTPLDETQREYAEQVAASGEHMLAIINDILDISKIETGRLELDATDFALRETIERACALGRIESRAKGIEFLVAIDDGLPWRVHGDGGRLRQIVMNLVANAVKFTSVGAVRVSASGCANGPDGTRLRIEVSDDGIGIDPDRLEQMFEPFTQADVSTTRKYGGTGLGLAIARELVELMGGEIGAESRPGSGSTFWFEIPLETAISEEDAPPPVLEVAGSGELDDSAPIVLVVDDTPVNQIVAVRALARCGCRAEVATNGYEALEALLERRYDAVLMDCQMPEMDGYEATHELRRREVGGRRTPVIAMTAAAMKGDFDRCIACGMDDYVSKPLRHRVLAETLERWIPALGVRTAHAA